MDMGGTLRPALLLTSLLGAWAGLGLGQGDQAVTVAVVFGSSGLQQAQARPRLTSQNFLDLPLEIQPLTVGVNHTNPSSLLTQICGLLGAARVHGIVFEDNVGTEAVAQLLDFVSSQTHVPILSISGGSAVVLTPKVPIRMLVPLSLGPAAREGLGPGKLALAGGRAWEEAVGTVILCSKGQLSELFHVGVGMKAGHVCSQPPTRVRRGMSWHGI